MNPTTRRYPRTLLEAFPCDASNANPIQRYRQPLPKRLFFGFLRNGWCAVPLYLIVLLMSGWADDLVAVQIMADDLKDSTARCHRGDIESAD